MAFPRPTDDVSLAVDALRGGGLVGLPTETVYGLAADASNADAVARVFAVKQRPTDHPLIVHTAEDSVDLLTELGWIEPTSQMTRAAALLASSFWPGPLTMLLPAGRSVLPSVTGGRPTVAVRVPSHPIARELLKRFGGAVAAPSANRFGRVSPTTADHVWADLGAFLDPDRDVILDGGSSAVGVESTIVDLTADNIEVLRDGAITAADVEGLLHRPVSGSTGPARAPGMLNAHYAPTGRVRLVESAADAALLDTTDGTNVVVIDRSADPEAAAQHLYEDLRVADRSDVDEVVFVLPPASGVGIAVRDRLRRAVRGSGSASRDG